VLLSLVKLYARSLWYTLQGGKDGLNLWKYDADKSAARLAIVHNLS
jgi:SEL1 protein